MGSSNIFEVVPYLEIAGSVPGFNLLVIPQANPQSVRHDLLRQAGGLARGS